MPPYVLIYLVGRFGPDDEVTHIVRPSNMAGENLITVIWKPEVCAVECVDKSVLCHGAVIVYDRKMREY